MSSASRRSPFTGRIARMALACLIGGFAVAGGLSLAWHFALGRLVATPPFTYDLVIPAGTADLVSKGAAPPSIPSAIDFREGDALRITNQDSVTHRVGQFLVAAGEEKYFPISAFLPGGSSDAFLCSFHPGSTLQLSVEEESGLTSAALATFAIGLPLALAGFVVLSVTSKLDA